MGLFRKISRKLQGSSNRRISPLPPASENVGQERRSSATLPSESKQLHPLREHKEASQRRSSVPGDSSARGSACSPQISASQNHSASSSRKLPSNMEPFIVRSEGEHAFVGSEQTADSGATVLIYICPTETSDNIFQAAESISAVVYAANSVAELEQLLNSYRNSCPIAAVFESACVHYMTAFLNLLTRLDPKVPRVVLAESDAETCSIPLEFTHVIKRSRSTGIVASLQCSTKIAKMMEESSTKKIPWYNRKISNRSSMGASAAFYSSRSISRSLTSSVYGAGSNNSAGSSTGNWIPLYMRNCPHEVLEAFGGDYRKGIGLYDPPFRKIVKTFCQLPAYFGIVLFQRVIEYRDLVLQLLEEKRLQLEPDYRDLINDTAAVPSEKRKTIFLRDLLRVWTPDLRKASRTEKFIRLAQPPSKEYVLALETTEFPRKVNEGIQKKVLMRDVQPFVEALVERHPDLHFLKRRPVLRSRYVTTVLSSIFASLHGLCTGIVSLRELRQSNIAEMFHSCASVGLEEITPFSISRFQQLHSIYSQAAKLSDFESIDSPDEQELCAVKSLAPSGSTMDKALADTTSVSPKSLRKNMRYRYPPSVEQRIFSSSVRTITSGEEGKLNFEDYMWFSLARQDRASDFSMEYWFRALDFDNDGYLSDHDVLQCLKEKQEVLPENGCLLRKISDLLGTNLSSDMHLPLVHFRRYCSGPAFYEAVLNIKDSKNTNVKGSESTNCPSD